VACERNPAFKDGPSLRPAGVDIVSVLFRLSFIYLGVNKNGVDQLNERCLGLSGAVMENLYDMGQFATEALSNDTISFVAWYDDGRIVTCNPPFVELTGYTREEMDDMEWPWDFTTPKTFEMISKSIDTLKHGLKTYRHEGVCIRKDGTTVPIDIAVHRHYDPTGKFLFHYSFISDISKSKKFEEALIAAKAQADLYIDLMGHDIRNMNQASMGFLEMAISHPHDAQEKELMNKALDAINNSSRIIDNVRKLQRVQLHELKYEPVEVCKVLSEVRSAHVEMQIKPVTINMTPGCKCFVNANALLQDVFLNLVTNSIKHSTGPVTIDIIVLDMYEGDRHYCKVVVQDNGPGIPDELKRKLFARHQHGPTKAQGSGLGLYLAKILVEDFGGRIWVEDRVPGDYTKGARFVVVLLALENNVKK